MTITEEKVDLASLAEKLAAKIGGHIKPNSENSDDHARIEVSNATIVLRRDWRKNGGRDMAEVCIYSSVPGQDALHYSERSGSKSAKLTVTRGIDVLAEAIKKKLIEPFQPEIERLKAKINEKKTDAATLQSRVAAYSKRLPLVTFNIIEGDAKAAFHYYDSHKYISGHFYAQGELSIDGISGFSNSQMLDILSSLFQD